MQIETRHIDTIKPYWRNPRKNEHAVEAVRQSIDEYGYTVPIVIDAENVIITGHTRYKALRELGIEEIQCVVSDMGAEKAKKFRIIDNKSAELADWDITMLVPELREIADVSDMQIFFPDLSLESFLMETGGGDGEGLDSPSQDDIDATQKNLDGQYDDSGGEDPYIELICPHCAETFAMARSELKAKKSFTPKDVDL